MRGTFAKLNLDAEQIKTLQTTLKEYGANCDNAFHEYLMNHGADIIESNIQKLIHPSNHNWKGKPEASKTASKDRVFEVVDGDVPSEIIIKLRKKYVYLIYPDHKQGFLQDAVDNSVDRILKDLIDLLGKGE